MNEDVGNSVTKRVKRFGTTAFAVGILSVLVCELPILLTLAGLGGLSSAVSTISLPPMVELVGIVVGLLGLSIVVGLVIYRTISKVES